LGQIADVGVNGTLRYSGIKLFLNYSNLCDHGTWTSQTDSGTDGRTCDILWHNRALPSKTTCPQHRSTYHLYNISRCTTNMLGTCSLAAGLELCRPAPSVFYNKSTQKQSLHD